MSTAADQSEVDLETRLANRRADENWMVNKSLVECYKHLFRTKEAADITFSVEYKEGPSKNKPIKVHAHKTILLTRSPVFNVMFCGEIPELKPEIVVDDVEPEAFEELLRYIYTDEINITPDNVLYILYASNKYIVPAVSTMCSNFLQQQLTNENVCSILEHSVFFNDEALINRSLQLIQKEAGKVIESEAFLTLSVTALQRILDIEAMSADEVDLFAGVMGWALAKCERKKLESTGENQRKVLGDMLFKIRFPSMKLQEFADLVVPTGILTSEEGYLIFQHLVCQSKPPKELIPFRTEPRNKAYSLPTLMKMPGPYESKTIASKHQQTYQLMCLISKDIKLKSLYVHDFKRDGHELSRFEIHLSNITDPSSKSVTIESLNGEVLTLKSQTCMKIPMKDSILKQGKIKVTINHWVEPIMPSTPLQASFTFSHREHSICFGKNDKAYVLSDKLLNLKIARTDEMPLLGIEYMLA